MKITYKLLLCALLITASPSCSNLQGTMTGGALGAAVGSVIPSNGTSGGSNMLYGAAGGAIVGGLYDYITVKNNSAAPANPYYGDGLIADTTDVADEFISPHPPHNRIKVLRPYKGKIVIDNSAQKIFKLP